MFILKANVLKAFPSNLDIEVAIYIPIERNLVDAKHYGIIWGVSLWNLFTVVSKKVRFTREV